MQEEDIIVQRNLPPDADRPKAWPPKVLKSDEQVVAEFHEKTEYLLTNHEVGILDLEEIDLREFVAWIFERRDGRHKEYVVPFEDIQSNEYQLWLKQKKENRAQMDYRGYGCWRYNPVVYYTDGDKNRHRVLLNDDEDTMRFLEQRQFALLSPVTYVGRNNTAVNARYLYALAFDLDGVGTRQIKKLCWMINGGDVPMPNLITNSGHGLHLYYLLERPIPLYRENIKLLNKLKYGLTNIIWNYHTSTDIDRQHQGVLQGFRLPGTLTKFGEKIRAFHSCEAPFHKIEDLNEFLFTYKLTKEEVKQLWKEPFYDPTGVTREEAARRWPEWYAAKVLGHRYVNKKWNVNRAVYDWWLKRLWDANDEIKVHHRYWCILTLVTYAVKCNVPREEVLRDAYKLVPKMDTYTDTEDNHFTTSDVDDAMKAYDEKYCTWPIHTIESTTLFRIDKNRRNTGKNGKSRGRETHLKVMNFVRDNIAFPGGGWRNKEGRPKATFENSDEAMLVRLWRVDNPLSKNKSACARDTGLSRPTVRKWWEAPGTEK